jgi:RNA polymerase sigma-70 factor (ECF subfamily)
MTEGIRREMVALLPRLRRFAYAVSGSLDEADDLVQEGCERALSRLDQFEAGSRLDSWMFRIIQNVWIDRRRAHVRRSTDNDMEALAAVPHDARIIEQTEARSTLSIVRREVARLPDEQRLVLSLIVVDGLTYQEAASILEIPIGTVMSRLARARKRLAALIEAGPGLDEARGSPL